METQQEHTSLTPEIRREHTSLTPEIRREQLSTPLSTRDIYPLKDIKDADPILQERLKEAYDKINEIFGITVELYLYGSQRRGTRRYKKINGPDIDVAIYHHSLVTNGTRIEGEVYRKLGLLRINLPFTLDVGVHVKPPPNDKMLRIYC